MGSPHVRMPLPKRFTLDEYLIVERKAATKSEFHQGQILAMPGGTPVHSLIANTIGMELGFKMKGRPCSVYNSDLRMAVADSEAAYYPDVSVVCGDTLHHDRRRDLVTNTCLVVEVLSRSTARYDRMVKVPMYQKTPSIMDILLVTQERARVEHFTRAANKWKSVTYSSLTDVIELPSLVCSIALADIYEKVIF